MQFDLSDFNGDSDLGCSASARQAGECLKITFEAQGNIEDIKVQEFRGIGTVKDRLWATTCFEVFIGEAQGRRYIEWNFATSGDYAVYQFDDIRTPASLIDDRPIAALLAPESITCQRLINSLTLEVQLDLRKICDHLGLPKWFIKPTIVIENTKLGLQYWAPFHSKSEPDFHDFSDCIALDPFDPRF